MRKLLKTGLCVIAPSLILTASAICLGAEQDQSPTQTVFGDLMEQAADYSIHDDQANTFRLAPKPVLFWSNPTRNKGQKGCMVLWNLDGRPQVVGSLFTFVYNGEIRLKHEYHSLSEKPLQASYQGRAVWEPQPNIKWHTAEVAAPRDNPRLRLVQMRSLARQFTGHLEDFNGNSSQLELKPTPLYRYSSEKSGVTDGAIFSFALGTDPEVLMMIESRVGENDKPTWTYAFARFHYYRVWIKDGSGQMVWEGDQSRELQTLDLGDPVARRRAYATYYIDRAPFDESDDE